MNFILISRGVAILSLFWLAGCSSTFGAADQAPVGSTPARPTVAATPASLPSSSGADETLSAPAPTLVPVTTDSYQLGEGDQIAIQVFDEPDLTMSSRVGSGGSINYSYLGDLAVAGRTTVELERQITEQLRNGYLVNPSVNVTIIEFRPFFIGGEVKAPGSYPYQPGLTLNKAIALAGGMTDRASSRRIFISKPSGDEFRASLTQDVSPGDIITINEGFF